MAVFVIALVGLGILAVFIMIAKGILIFNCKLLSEYFTIRKNRIKNNRQRMKAS
uniref:Candidate secreted effector n=1 Tax=Meloidogyne incognita TaxID=6306 RepID=A0A914N7D9_MELIC